MKVTLNFGDDELPIWNKMLATYVPVQKHIAELGINFEKSAEDVLLFQNNEYDESDHEKVMKRYELMLIHEDARLKLAPFLNQWAIARHGLSLN